MPDTIIHVLQVLITIKNFNINKLLSKLVFLEVKYLSAI